MYRQKDPQVALSAAEMKRALRKHVNPYQMYTLDRLTDGKDHWMWFVGKEGATRKEFVLMQARNMTGDEKTLTRLVNGKPQGDPVFAFVLDGRWVARCPDCLTGQEVVSRDQPGFVCLNTVCLNIVNGHYPRPVKFPPAGQMKKIEETLLARPNPVNRAWDAQGLATGKAETVADLKAENLKHSLPPAIAVEREG